MYVRKNELRLIGWERALVMKVWLLRENTKRGANDSRLARKLVYPRVCGAASTSSHKLVN